MNEGEVNPSGENENIHVPPLWHESIKLLCDCPEELSIRSRSIGEATLAEISSPPVVVTQDSTAVPAQESHPYHLILLLEGGGTYHWSEGRVQQAPGDIILLDTATPSRVISPTHARLLRWSLPEPLIAPFLPINRRDPVIHLPAGDGLMAILARHTCELTREAERLDNSVQHGLLAHLCGLLGLAIEAKARPNPKRRHNYRSFQRQRVLAYIETHLRDPRLTARQAASDLGISPRWLHALLEDMGDSFTGLVARRRLEDSLARLADPGSDQLSITEIAFLAGFNDLSTFYRRFGKQYGMSPGEARRVRGGTSLAPAQPAPEDTNGLSLLMEAGE